MTDTTGKALFVGALAFFAWHAHKNRVEAESARAADSVAVSAGVVGTGDDQTSTSEEVELSGARQRALQEAAADDEEDEEEFLDAPPAFDELADMPDWIREPAQESLSWLTQRNKEKQGDLSALGDARDSFRERADVHTDAIRERYRDPNISSKRNVELRAERRAALEQKQEGLNLYNKAAKWIERNWERL